MQLHYYEKFWVWRNSESLGSFSFLPSFVVACFFTVHKDDIGGLFCFGSLS